MNDKFLYPNGSCFNFNTSKLNSLIEEKVSGVRDDKKEDDKAESVEVRMKKDSNLFVKFKNNKFVVIKDRYENREGQEVRSVSDLIKLFSEYKKVVVTNFDSDESQIRSFKEGLSF